MKKNELCPRSPRQGLIEARRQRGLSQIQVASLLKTTNVNVSRWENGITVPSAYYQMALCRLFGKTAAALDLSAGERKEKGIGWYDSAIPYALIDSLVGRESLLEELRSALRPGTVHALYGLPGVGKTTLAVALARHASIQRLYDGILWVGLGPEPQVLEAFKHWGDVLGISLQEHPTTEEAWVKILHQAIGTRKILIVIDDAWEIEHALRLKIGNFGCTYLLTTRLPEVALQFAEKQAIKVDELHEDSGLQLLIQLAGTPEEVPEQTRKEMRNLVRSVGGLPLAITLLGKYLYRQMHSGQPRRMQVALARLLTAQERLHVEIPVSPWERPGWMAAGSSLSLQAALAVSEQQLDENVRKVLHALALFQPKPASFSEEAALAIAACGVSELDLLYQAGFLESKDAGRYYLHRTIADYARLHGEKTFPQVADRFVRYYVQFIEANHPEDELEKERGNIVNMLQIAYTIQHELCVRAICGFVPYLLSHGFYDLSEHYLRCALQEVDHDQRCKARLLHLLNQALKAREAKH
jgi:transcriptional regulator with XRE-family HTH domain